MPDKRKILLHTCCAVCFEAVLPALADEGFSVTALFYNPNIHPYVEFSKRLRAAEVAAEVEKVPFIADKKYGLALYLDSVPREAPGRCPVCYLLRLSAAARIAAEKGFDTFTTTLLASSHQDHDAVRAAGEAVADSSVAFLYRDWRDRLESGKEIARRRSLYRQQYCGCLWSEYERYAHAQDPSGDRQKCTSK